MIFAKNSYRIYEFLAGNSLEKSGRTLTRMVAGSQLRVVGRLGIERGLDGDEAQEGANRGDDRSERNNDSVGIKHVIFSSVKGSLL